MTIENRNLRPGTHLVAKYHKQPYACEVIQAEGKLRYRLGDGREFTSLSAAGIAITGKACNGWVFWNLDTVTAPTSAGAPIATEATIEKTSPEKKHIFRIPNQKGVPEGQVRWYCHDCAKSFLVVSGETPTTCPAGHRA